jgi:hypothetical protein
VGHEAETESTARAECMQMICSNRREMIGGSKFQVAKIVQSVGRWCASAEMGLHYADVVLETSQPRLMVAYGAVRFGQDRLETA